MAEDEDIKEKKVNASLEGDEAPIDDEGEGKSKSSKKLLVLIAVPLLLLGGGAAAFFTGALDQFIGGGEQTEGEHGEEAAGGHEAANSDGHGDSSGGGHGAPAGGPIFLAMPNQRVNLNSEGGPPTFLQLNIQLEVKTESDKAKLEAVMPRVIDQFQTYLRELRVRDLKGSAGIYRLQAELLNRVNAAAAPIEVQDVLFQEILIQEN